MNYSSNGQDAPMPTPRQVAEQLRASGMAEDDVMDMLKELGDKTGWTPQINDVGLHYLKPDAPEDTDAARAA